MNQYARTLLRVILILSVSLSIALQAQTDRGQNDPETAILEGYVQDFCSAYSAMTTTKNKENLLKLVSKHATSAIFYFSISEKVRQQTSTYDGFDKYLDRVISTPGMSIRYDLEKILHTYVNGNVATSVFLVDYEIKEEGGFHAKGKEAVTFGWKKESDVWKIVHYTVLGTEDEKLRGTCLCEVFSSKGGEYIVRTTVPSGRSYNTGFNEFEVRKLKDVTYIKTKDNTYFKLKSNGDIWQLEGESGTKAEFLNETKRIGRAKEEKGAILLVIKSYIYPDNCTNIKYEE